MRLSDLNLIFALYCVNIVFDHVLSKGKGYFLTQYFQEIPLSKVERK